MGDLPFSACALVRLPSEHRLRTEWLSSLLPASKSRRMNDAGLTLAFGDQPSSAERPYAAAIVGFSASGLARLGLNEGVAGEGMSTFPTAFNIGMANRGRALGDP